MEDEKVEIGSKRNREGDDSLVERDIGDITPFLIENAHFPKCIFITL